MQEFRFTSPTPFATVLMPVSHVTRVDPSSSCRCVRPYVRYRASAWDICLYLSSTSISICVHRYVFYLLLRVHGGITCACTVARVRVESLGARAAVVAWVGATEVNHGFTDHTRIACSFHKERAWRVRRDKTVKDVSGGEGVGIPS